MYVWAVSCERATWTRCVSMMTTTYEPINDVRDIWRDKKFNKWEVFVGCAVSTLTMRFDIVFYFCEMNHE